MNELKHIWNEVVHGERRVTWWLLIAMVWLDGLLCGQLIWIL